jgi:hypothetical protein
MTTTYPYASAAGGDDDTRRPVRNTGNKAGLRRAKRGAMTPGDDGRDDARSVPRGGLRGVLVEGAIEVTAEPNRLSSDPTSSLGLPPSPAKVRWNVRAAVRFAARRRTTMSDVFPGQQGRFRRVLAGRGLPPACIRSYRSVALSGLAVLVCEPAAQPDARGRAPPSCSADAPRHSAVGQPTSLASLRGTVER